MWLASLSSGLLAGLVAVPHCAVMCGPLCAFACREGSASAPWRYQAGRTLAYVAVGGVVGGIGHGAVVAAGRFASGWGAAAVSWLLALALLGAAARLLWPRPKLAPLRRPRPTWFQRVASRAPREPLALGLVSVLLPCGALFAALGLAAVSGSIGGGGLTLLGFVVTSGLGLAAAGTLGRGLARLRGPWASRALCGLLLLGAALLVYRPIPGLASGRGVPTCHVQRSLP